MEILANVCYNTKQQRNGEKGEKMKQSFMSRVIGIVSLFMILLLMLQGTLQSHSSRKHFYQSADLSINQIYELLKRNIAGERELRDSLKDDYIIRAQACSYIIENSNISEQDVQELRKVAELLEVDEIHLFDVAGFIYAGTNPEYYGYNFDSGDQMRFFKPMLSDRELSLCQDVMPNTAEGKQMMYALVWREDGKGLVQIGLTPTRLLEQIERNKVSHILSEIPTNDNIYFVADHATGEIIECTQDGYQGKHLQEIGIERSVFPESGAFHFRAEMEKTAYLAAFEVCGDYEIGVCQAQKDVYQGTRLASLIMFIYLLAALAAIVIIVHFMTRKERQKEQEHQEQMQKALVRANAANEAKSVFLANMSHDIRTPMNAIIGFAELLEKNSDQAEKRDGYIAKIKSSGKYLLELLNNILEMARIESGEMTVEEKVWSLEQFNNTLLSFFQDEMCRKDLKFRKEIQVEHPYIWCDFAKVQEVFANLLSNAVKYTPEGGTITLRLREIPSDRAEYAVYQTEIEDTGIGISKEFLPLLFDEFARERNTTQSKIGGTGLGMPIAKKLVDIMGGSISVESEVGRGTRVTVVIPYRIADKRSMESACEAADISVNGFAGRRLLLAEDNELNAEIATEILEDFGFAVEHAKDGAVCVDMLQKAEPGYYDLILMDIQMPQMDGYQATKQIRALSGPRGDIPIIAMTANAFEEDKQHAFAAGMNGHIAKPIDVTKLMEALTEFLEET